MKRTVLSFAMVIAAATILACGTAWAAAASFAPAKNYPAGNDPQAVSAGDLDGDGDTDVVTDYEGSDSSRGYVSVLLRRSDGTLGAPRRYAMGDHPRDVIAREDLDGDGDRDLASANMHSDDISVRMGRGDGTFGPQRRYAAGPGSADAIESGDLDGDGDPDLVTANRGGNNPTEQGDDYTVLGNVSFFENKGDGTFRAARNYEAGKAYEPEDIDRSDFDGDGDEDLLVALGSTKAGDGGMAVLFNDGDGAFGKPHRYEQGFFCPTGVLAKDLDGDGDREALVADYCNEAVVVYENGGDGDFTYQDSYPVRDSNDLTEADFDGDGDIDIATANPGGPENSTVAVLANKGDGTLDAARYFGAGDGPAAITRARMNVDRKPDLVVANIHSDDVSVLRNTTN